MTVRKLIEKFGTVFACLLLFGFLLAFARNFASAANLLNVLKQTSFLAILAVGFTLALLTSELDLSFANICSLAAIVTGGLIHNGAPYLLAIVAGLSLGIAGGALNGILVTVLKVPSLIATLGTASIASGTAFMISGGVAFVGRWNAAFLAIARGELFGLPYLIIIMAVIVAAAYVLSTQTRLGIHMQATGEADEAARRTGINVRGMKFLGLTFSGLTAGITAILLVANLSSAAPQMAGGFLLDGIAAALLGMTMFTPGKPNIAGSFVGALIIALLANGLVLLGAPYYLQDITLGIIIVGSVSLSASVLKKAAFSV